MFRNAVTVIQISDNYKNISLFLLPAVQSKLLYCYCCTANFT